MSFGGDKPANYCATLPVDEADAAMCLAIDHANHRDIAMVASSGNARTDLEFPANDSRVIAAGVDQKCIAQRGFRWDFDRC